MYDDIRAYRKIQMTSMAEKMPGMDELFPRLSVPLQEETSSDRARVAELNNNPFIKFLREKAEESGETILQPGVV